MREIVITPAERRLCIGFESKEAGVSGHMLLDSTSTTAWLVRYLEPDDNTEEGAVTRHFGILTLEGKKFFAYPSRNPATPDTDSGPGGVYDRVWMTVNRLLQVIVEGAGIVPAEWSVPDHRVPWDGAPDQRPRFQVVRTS